ncbi:MAG TPA: SAF domain-containing protein [Caulobacterales bacterium]|nr:SAF domain-containing protein [Caulobacterales bacterium]
MIIVDRALAERAARNKPIRVGLIGAGFQAAGVALQIIRSTPGMTVAAIAARRPDQARACYAQAGVESAGVTNDRRVLEDAIRAGRPMVTEDHAGLAGAAGLDAIVELTGSIDYALEAILAAFSAGKHVLTMNAELDGLVGPLLKVRAGQAGVIYSLSDGDQPGVQMNLFRFVKGIGAQPLLCGNIKGLHDPYRNPATQAAFAAKWGQNPAMVASFADGTKIAFEQAAVANATGMRVARRGMLGPDFSGGEPDAPLTPINQAAEAFAPHLDPARPGLVDYVVGASPAPGVFVLAMHDDARQRRYLDLYKMGKGPIYCFYRPYHLCHFETPGAVARAVLFHDAVLAPAGAPRVGVIAQAKKPLAAGEIIDGLGGFCLYGVAENMEAIMAEDLLPIALAEGARLARPIARDQALTMADVEIPRGRLVDAFYREQQAFFVGRG